MIPGRGAFYQPTILTTIGRDNAAYFEEFFGPIAQVYIVLSDDEAIAPGVRRARSMRCA